MAAIASGLAQQGWRVVRFEFPYMARQRILGRRQGPDRIPVLQEALRQQVRLERGERPERPLVIGSKSMGGRVASLLVDELATSDGVHGCLCPAGRFADVFALRGYDSVQLAAAHELHINSEQPLTFACFDRRLKQAAALLQMEVLS